MESDTAMCYTRGYAFIIRRNYGENMARARLHPYLLILMLTVPVAAAGCLEIGGEFQLGNMGFTSSRSSSDTSFKGGDYFWGGSLYITQGVMDNFQVEGGVFRDLILGNVVYSLLQYRTDYFSLGIGPFLGLFNSSSVFMKSGISTLVRLELPGVAYVSLRTDGTLGNAVSTEGDYSEQRSDIALGFYVPNAICTLSLSSLEFVSMQGTAQVVDSLTEYSLKVVVFEKNVPFRLDFDFAYQVLLKKYIDGAANPTHGLTSFILGVGLDLLFSKEFSFLLDMETSVYTVGTSQLSAFSDVGFAPFLFRASSGFRLILGSPSQTDQESP
jgi:hypothetical protein